MFREFLDSIFPHSCIVCNAALIPSEEDCCLKCLSSLPKTDFHSIPSNQLERMFWGKADIELAATLCHFSKSSSIRKLVHALKYRGNKKAGRRLGRMMANRLENSWPKLDLIIPLPLHPKKQKQRGFNQSEVICEGIAELWGQDVSSDFLQRKKATETQTNKSIEERADNVEGIFEVLKPKALENKSVLLVDDVITTGATMASCARELNKIPGVKVYVAALAFSAP